MPVDPRTLPLVQPWDVSYVGEFPFPTNWFPDSDNLTRLDEGGNGLSMGPDGQSLYIGGYQGHKRLARISIPPTMGTMSTIVQQAAPIPNIQDIDPGEPSSAIIGGTLLWNGRLMLSAYIYYDGDSSAWYSHFKGQPDITAFEGPHRVVPSVFRPADLSNNWTPQRLGVGWTAGYMTPIPEEWRELLGGPALTGQCNIAIVGRTSFGPSASVFDPELVGTVLELESTTLCGYPSFATREDIFGTFDLFQVVGIAFVPGTRTLMFIGRKGLGATCYGPGTTDPDLHGVPVEGGTYCYDPLDGSKGYHAFPYSHYMWLYDATDLLAVRNNMRNPWEVLPYAIAQLPGSATDGYATARSACFDPATGRIYLAPNYGTSPRILVWQVGVGMPPVAKLAASVRGALTLSATLHVGLALAATVQATATLMAALRSSGVVFSAVVAGVCTASAELRQAAVQLQASATGGLALIATLSSAPVEPPIEPPVEPPTEEVVGHYKACLDIVIIRVNEPRE